MNKEKAIEQIKNLIKFTKKTREVIGTPQKDIEIVIGENQFYLSDELLQALDIAIKSLETRYQMNDKGEITPIDNEMTDKEKLTVEFTLEKYLQYANEQEVRLLDLIINYYKEILNKGYEKIKIETVISDLEEIKKQFVRS